MVRRVDRVPVPGFDEYAGLLALAAEHDAARDECTGGDERFLWNWDDLLSCK